VTGERVCGRRHGVGSSARTVAKCAARRDSAAPGRIASVVVALELEGNRSGPFYLFAAPTLSVSIRRSEPAAPHSRSLGSGNAPVNSLPLYVLLFADIARYSTLGDPEQKGVVERLQAAVADTYPGRELSRIESGVFIATGDGMVIAFKDEGIIRQPEQVVTFATELQRRLMPAKLRIGLHVGTANPYRDLNAKNFFKEPTASNNLAGAAINIAQRVMSLGDPGDVLATEEFRDYYASQRGDADAKRTLHELGTVRVKHGVEVYIFKHHFGAGQVVVPRRIKDYLEAQNAVFRVLDSMRLLVRGAAEPSQRTSLRTRVALLLYDELEDELYVSGFRVGDQVDPTAPPSNVRFERREGPGRALRDRKVYYVRALPDPEANRDEYCRELEKQTGIRRHKADQFRRASRSYIYYPVSYGLGNEPFGVVSIDMMCPLWRRVKRREENKRLDGINRAIREDAVKLGYVWTIINQYY
jgi:class 3 adenylate cyclase